MYEAILPQMFALTILENPHVSSLSPKWHLMLNEKCLFIPFRQAEREREATGDSGEAYGEARAEPEGLRSSEAGERPPAGEAGAQQPGKHTTARLNALQQGGAAQVHTQEGFITRAGFY